MTTSTFGARLARTEQAAQSHPRAYRLRLFGLAVLGYGYIATMLTLLTTLAVLLFALSVTTGLDRWSVLGFGLRYIVQGLALVVVAVIVFCVRGLCTRVQTPTGLTLRPDRAPALFAAIEDARRAVQGPRMHRVLLTDDFNARVVQRPLLGPLGWYRNEVILGLPLLDALSPDELRAVLAHEMGHHAGGHGQFASRIYVLRRTWVSLLDGLERNQPVASYLFAPFFSWYAPSFAAYSLVMVRNQERAADRIAAGLAGSRALADALVKLRIQQAYLVETFWPEVLGRADRSPAPPDAIFDELEAILRAGLPPGDAEARLAAALAEEAGIGDTHPSLSERLGALEQSPRVPPATIVTAAEHLLRPSLDTLRQHLNRSWQAEVRVAWEARHQESQSQTVRLTDLEEKSAREPLSIREQWERATLTAAVHGNQWAIPRFRELVRVRPRSASARLALGQALLAEHDDAGLGAVEQGLQLAPELVDDAMALVEEYLTRWGRSTELAEYRRRFGQVRATLAADGDRSFEFRPDDRFLPHELSEQELAPLLELLDGCPGLESAYLVRWQWPAFPDVILFIVTLVRQPALARNTSAAAAMRQHFSDAVEVPGNTRLWVASPRDERLQQAMAQVDGSLIFERGGQQHERVA